VAISVVGLCGFLPAVSDPVVCANVIVTEVVADATLSGAAGAADPNSVVSFGWTSASTGDQVSTVWVR
jgi:hypothetical protein